MNDDKETYNFLRDLLPLRVNFLSLAEIFECNNCQNFFFILTDKGSKNKHFPTMLAMKLGRTFYAIHAMTFSLVLIR